MEKFELSFQDQEEMDEYLDYLEELSPFDLDKEIEWLQSVGKAKQSGKNFVINDSFYAM